jgi:hypothetical protein
MTAGYSVFFGTRSLLPRNSLRAMSPRPSSDTTERQRNVT